MAGASTPPCGRNSESSHWIVESLNRFLFPSLIDRLYGPVV